MKWLLGEVRAMWALRSWVDVVFCITGPGHIALATALYVTGYATTGIFVGSIIAGMCCLIIAFTSMHHRLLCDKLKADYRLAQESFTVFVDGMMNQLRKEKRRQEGEDWKGE